MNASYVVGPLGPLQSRPDDHLCTGCRADHGVQSRPNFINLENVAPLFLNTLPENYRFWFGPTQLIPSLIDGPFGPCRALAITTDRINEYIGERQAAKAANATIRNELAALRRMFTLAIQADKVAQAPYVPSPRVSNTRSGFFEMEQFHSVLKHLPVDLRPVVEFAYLTGWRRGEILGLEWRNVDFRAGEVRLDPGATKNSEARTFPFSAYPPLGELLKWQQERTVAVEKKIKRIVGHVFHRNGKAIRDFRGSWEKACEKAGVQGRLVHDFRRTAVRNLERAGVPRSVAMKLTGHKTETVYRRYAIVSPADLKAGVEKLAKLHVEQSAGTPAKVVVVFADRKTRT
jgi:integrase